MLHKLAQRIAEYLSQELSLDNSRKEIITYGLEAVLGAIVKLFAFITIPLFLGVFPQTWVALATSAFFRFPTGGAHCTAFYRCLIGSLFTFIFLGALAKITVDFFPVNSIFGISIILGLFAVMFWVPADTMAKPVTRKSDKRKAQLCSYAILFFYILFWFYYNIPQDLLLAASFGLLTQVFTVTPLGYRTMEKLDQVLIRITHQVTKRREVTS